MYPGAKRPNWFLFLNLQCLTSKLFNRNFRQGIHQWPSIHFPIHSFSYNPSLMLGPFNEQCDGPGVSLMTWLSENTTQMPQTAITNAYEGLPKPNFTSHVLGSCKPWNGQNGCPRMESRIFVTRGPRLTTCVGLNNYAMLAYRKNNSLYLYKPGWDRFWSFWP